MTEAETIETMSPRYILTKDKFMLSGEFEVPARVLDLLTSFVDSSIKPKYHWNRPPFRKLRRDGSYWQVSEINIKVEIDSKVVDFNAICIFTVSWTSGGEVCLFPNDLLVLNVRFGAVFREMWTDGWMTEVELKSKYRDGGLPLFDVYRKLKFYKFIMSKTKEEEHETPAAETKTG